MFFSVNFSWPAGSWVNTVGLIVWNYFTKLGYKVYWDKEYQSIIKWWNNNFINYIWKDDVYLSNKIDLFFAFNDEAIERNKNVYNIKNIVKVPQNPDYFQNIVALSMFFKWIWLKQEDVEDIIKTFFWDKIKQEIWEKNKKSIQFGFEQDIDFNYKFEKLKESKNIFVDGNYLTAEKAVDEWLEFYSAYPMTPASTLIKYITKHKEVNFFQWEDEIAVAMSMLGARFAGKKAMCWTSWWGFALMSESISYANQAEIGGIYVLSQRAGPSTWTPTFTEQADILYALNASFWDTKPIVVYPWEYENIPKLVNKVFYWADKYQHPIIFLLDKQVSESYLSIDLDILKKWEKINIDDIKYNPENKEKFAKIKEIENNTFLRYSFSKSWISPYTYPGIKNGEFIASSYEHTESGATTEDSKIKKLMTEKRHKKMETFIKDEFNEDFQWFTVYNENAKKFFITMWINSLTLKKYIKENTDYGLIIVEVLQPLDLRLKEFIKEKNVEEIIFVELNYSWQLEEIITSKLNLNCENIKISHIRKYENYPLFIEDIKF